MSPLMLSVTVGLAATLLSLPPAVAIAWLVERRRFVGRGLLHGIVLMPLVLPPIVTGYLLLYLFSPRRPVGSFLAGIGLPVAFHWLGAVAAAAVGGFPLLVMSIALSLRAVDGRLEMVSRTLGRGPFATFWRVTLPLVRPGIIAGALLSFARGLGEFGATIVLAGRIPGETETIPLAIHAQLDRPGGEAEVTRLVVVSLIAAAVSIWGARRLEARR